jgi:periplasmic copper chaperone A
MLRQILAAVAGLVLASSAFAQVTVKEPWVRGTVAEQKATGAFMQLTSTADAKLIEARSPVAKIVEVHEMVMVENTMKMRAVQGGLELPAGKTVELKPGSYHVMLIDLKAPLKEGDVVPLTLVVQGKDGKKETVEVKAPVRALNAAAPAKMEEMHKSH